MLPYPNPGPKPSPKPSPIPGPKPSPNPYASPNASPGPHQVLSLTSITMHALNVIFMLAEFALNGLLVEAWHLGLIVAWASLYGLFNGLQAILTHDTVYFFMDFR